MIDVNSEPRWLARRALVRIAATCLCTMIPIGCDQPEPTRLGKVVPADAEPVDLSGVPVYRLWDGDRTDADGNKVQIGDEDAEVLLVTPTLTARELPPDSSAYLTLEAVLEGIPTHESVHDFGISIRSTYGEARHVVPAAGFDPSARISAIPVDAREGLGERANRSPLKSANVSIKPLLPQPSEIRSEPLSIPEGMALHVSMAVDADSSDALSFRIDVINSGKRRTILEETIEPQSPPRWVERRIPLPADTDEPTVLAFSAGAGGANSPKFANPLWGDVYIFRDTPAQAPSPPNVLLISLDTLRADRLGLYGFDRETSPTLDSLGGQSVVFSQCFAPTSWTLPSHLTLFTGLNVVTHPRDPKRNVYRLNPDVRFLAEYARDAGYLTVGFTEGILVAAEYGFSQGFGTYSDGPGVSPLPPASAEITFSRAREWMDGHRNVPFFMFLHTYQIHSPYEPPEPFRSRFYDGPLTSVIPEEPDLTAQERAAVEPLYQAEVAYTDHVLGELLSWMRETGLLDQTLVVVFSDHGEELFDHGGTSHGYTLYNETLHVPLIMRFPGPNPPSGRVDRPVALGDLFSTLTDFMGLESVHANDSQSLLGLCEWQTNRTRYDRTAIMSQLKQFANKDFVLVAAQDAAFKYIAATRLNNEASPLRDYIAMVERGEPLEPALLDYLGGMETIAYAPVLDPQRQSEYAAREILYDLIADPREQSAVDNPSETKRLREALRAELTRVLDDAASLDIGGPASVSLTEEQRKELEALGYIQ